MRARQRALVLLPLLSKIYERVSLDPKVMCPAIQHAVMGIAHELNAQVRSGALHSCMAVFRAMPCISAFCAHAKASSHELGQRTENSDASACWGDGWSLGGAEQCRSRCTRLDLLHVAAVGVFDLLLCPYPNPGFEQCELISNFTESSFIKRGFTSGKFQGAMDGSGAKINDHIKMLGLALAEGACEHCVPVVTHEFEGLCPCEEMPPANALRKPCARSLGPALCCCLDSCFRKKRIRCILYL